MKNIKTIHTDDNYYSKNDLKLKLNNKFSNDFWKEVLDYREKYTFEIPLIFFNKKNMKLTQTPWILQKEIKMITNFSKIQQVILDKISTKYSASTLLEDIENKSMVSDIHWLMNKDYKKNIISRGIIEDIVIQNKDIKSQDEIKINNLYENFCRISKKITSPREIANLFFGIKEIKNQELNDIHSSLIETIRTEKISSLLTKVSSIVYSIEGNKMFGDKSYEVMVISLMSLLKNSYKGVILKGMSFFKVLDYFENDIKKSIINVKDDKGDLTYLTQTLIKILMYCVRISNFQIESFIKNEIRYNSLSARDKNKNINYIIKNYPMISRRQANFFVSHNDPRASYTISDFQKYIGSSYETSRYSLQNLVDLGFYKKKKIGKKYVYKTAKQQ